MNISISLQILETVGVIYLGLFMLNLSMERNAKLIFNKALSPKIVILNKMVGWCLLVIGLYCSTLIWGKAIGIVAWFGILTFSIGFIVFIQAYQSRLNLNLAVLIGILIVGLQFF